MGSGADPINETEADSCPDHEKWTEAKWIELNGLARLKCWTYVDPEEAGDEKIYRGKFCFTLKPPANGQPARYKARWVISDPRWSQRILDVDTYSPTLRLETLRYVMAELVQRDWDIIEVDIVNAVLDLDDDILDRAFAVIKILPVDANHVGPMDVRTGAGRQGHQQADA